MKDLTDLRRDRKAAAEQMSQCAEDIQALEARDGGPDEAEMTAAVEAFDAAKAEFEAADAKVKRAEAVERAQAACATSEAGDPVGAPAGQDRVAATAKNENDKGVAAGAMIHALMNSGGDKMRAAQHLEDNGMSGISAALSGATAGAGGVTIPQEQSAELIELLRPRVTVRASGARVIDMPAGQVKVGRQSAGATAGYTAENASITESEPAFDSVSESFKKLTCLVPIGNSLLRHSSIQMMRLVRDDTLRTMAAREDLAFLRGDGTANTPVGLLNWTPAANKQAGVANTAVAVEAAIRRMVSQVEDADVVLSQPGWIMRASAKNFLASLRDSASGAYVFPSIERDGTLKGFPIRTTSQIPDNLGAAGNETEVYFADFDEVLIGDSMMITVATSGEAAYVDTAGNTVSAFQNDLTLMRAISERDMAPRHDVALSMLNGVDWTI